MAEQRHLSSRFEEIGKDTIVIEFSGDLDCDQCVQALDEFNENVDRVIIRKARENGGKINVLVDVSGFGKFNDAAVGTLMRSVDRTKGYENRIAVCGANPLIKKLTNVLLSLTRHDDVKFFSTKEEALAWIKAGPKTPLDVASKTPLDVA